MEVSFLDTLIYCLHYRFSLNKFHLTQNLYLLDLLIWFTWPVDYLYLCYYYLVNPFWHSVIFLYSILPQPNLNTQQRIFLIDDLITHSLWKWFMRILVFVPFYFFNKKSKLSTLNCDNKLLCGMVDWQK